MLVVVVVVVVVVRCDIESDRRRERRREQKIGRDIALRTTMLDNRGCAKNPLSQITRPVMRQDSPDQIIRKLEISWGGQQQQRTLRMPSKPECGRVLRSQITLAHH